MFVLWSVLSGLVHTVWALSTRQPKHSCQSDQDCAVRMAVNWPAYNFVCCTTILCDENYGNYYLVHSGCITAYNCQSDSRILNRGTTLTARLRKSIWDQFESNSLNNCPQTRQNLANIPDLTSGHISPASSVHAPSAKVKLPAAAVGRHRPRAVSKCPKLEKTCAHGGQTCCVVVECRDSLDKNGYYTVKDVCAKTCKLFTTNVGTAYKFHIPPNTWSLRGEYERKELSPSVTSSCRETRYFYFWAKGSNGLHQRWRLNIV